MMPAAHTIRSAGKNVPVGGVHAVGSPLRVTRSPVRTSTSSCRSSSVAAFATRSDSCGRIRGARLEQRQPDVAARD